MVNKTQIGIAIGLMCILLTSAIVIQLNTIKEATKIVGTSYAESELKEEVLIWKESYERIYRDLENKERELETVRQESTKENSRLKELQNELEEINKRLGLTEVTGSGMILTVKDNDTINTKEPSVDPSEIIVHAEDLIELVNEFKNAGGEAISINGQRIVGATSISCSGTVITINDAKLNSPFEIRVIGYLPSLRTIKRPRRIFIQDGR